MKKILFPLIKAGSGADIFISNLVHGLQNHSICADIQIIPPITGIFPAIAGKLCDPSGYDLIHGNTWSGYAFNYGYPLIMTEHHVVHDPDYLRHSSLPQRSYYRLVYHRERKSLNCADKVTCVSRYTQKKTEEIFGYSDSKVIYNGIDRTVFKPLHISRDKVGISENKTVLLFVGNLSFRKGADLLQPIMKKLGDDFLLLINAGLRDRGIIKQDNIINLGKLSLPQLIEAYNLCDIFLSPSRLEGFGLSIAEAMACAKPIVTSNCSSLPELVIDDKGGLLCTPGDIQMFTEAVHTLSEDPSWREKQGRFNRSRISECFTIERMGCEYAHLYNSL